MSKKDNIVIYFLLMIIIVNFILETYDHIEPKQYHLPESRDFYPTSLMTISNIDVSGTVTGLKIF